MLPVARNVPACSRSPRTEAVDSRGGAATSHSPGAPSTQQVPTAPAAPPPTQKPQHQPQLHGRWHKTPPTAGQNDRPKGARWGLEKG